MIVIAILGILAAIMIPKFQESDDLTRTRVMAAGVRHIRQLIEYHASARDTTISAGGFPNAIDANWFRNGIMPEHTWTIAPMIVNEVTGAATDYYPATKTFNPSTAGAANAWYNRTNGAFCVLVPAQVDDAATLQIFNDANLGECTTLAQTTK